MSAQKAFWGRCGGCDFVWLVAFLQMDLRRVSRLAKAARCPKCGSDEIFVGAAPKEKPPLGAEGDPNG
jgi:hypothetical protein